MRHIAIIEDEKGITNFLKQGLEEEGYTISVAHSGDVGLKLIQEQSIDLILLDWMLPELEGLEICKIVRETDKQTPILFLTAKDTVEETIMGLEAGANDYIKKPFSFAELLARIEVHFREEEEPSILRLGDIVINKSTYQVTQNSKEVSLTQREFELLVYLIRNKDKVCTRQCIIEKIWNIDFEYDTGVIDVFINALRRKLELDKEDGYIKTIRGVGYMVQD